MGGMSSFSLEDELFECSATSISRVEPTPTFLPKFFGLEFTIFLRGSRSISLPVTSVFISHSKKDKDLRGLFSEAFAMAGVKAHYMEFEDLSNTYAAVEIAKRIQDVDTQALFVLLSHNMASIPQTRNWVSFEVGVATGIRIQGNVRKDIWVFEPSDMGRVDFAVPYLDYFVMYPRTDEFKRWLRGKLERYKTFYLPVFGDPVATDAPPATTCPHCFGSYVFWNEDINRFYCPVCRVGLSLKQTPQKRP